MVLLIGLIKRRWPQEKAKETNVFEERKEKTGIENQERGGERKWLRQITLKTATVGRMKSIKRKEGEDRDGESRERWGGLREEEMVETDHDEAKRGRMKRM